MITVETVSRWLEFALQQLAAESYLHGVPPGNVDELIRRLKFGFNDPTHPYVRSIADNDADSVKLDGYNRMNTRAAEAFAARYRIIDHHANDSTGFSATLLFDTQTEQYTLTMRSTEFREEEKAGDRGRDVKGADLEIGLDGFAFAQLLAMEDYFAKIKSDPSKLPTGTVLNVTGYSLSGHLATIFTLLHQDEVSQTYTFNAAGHGVIAGSQTNAADIAGLLGTFRNLLLNPERIDVDSLLGSSGTDPLELRDGQTRAIALKETDPDWDPFTSEDGAIEGRQRIYDDPRYIFAKAVATRYLARTEALVSLADVFTLANGSEDTSGLGYDKITQLYGLATHDDRTIVANSQRHTKNLVRVFIEDQPDNFGWPNFLGGKGGFGTTHGIVLLIDSLALTKLFLEVAPALTMEDIQGIFAASSNMRGQGGPLLTGRSEGDSLERALDALRRIVATPEERSSFSPTRFDPTNDGFGNFGNRNVFYANLDQVRERLRATVVTSFVGPLGDEPAGQAPTPLSAADLEALGRSELAYRYALKELNPFAVIDSTLYGEYRAGGRQAGELEIRESPDDANAQLSEDWLRDRAAFLYRKLVANLQNLNNDFSKPINDATAANDVPMELSQEIYEDRASGYRIQYKPAALTPWIVFGRDGGDDFRGGDKSDRLYGGSGPDRIAGGLGDDLIEGGFSGDALIGNAGKDRLVGGPGDDELTGGIEDDVLIGGAGVDTYVINSGDGTDIIRDTGRNFVNWNGRLIAGLFERAGWTGFYRFLSTDPGLRDLTLTFNSPATLSDGTGTSLVLESYQSPEAFVDGAFGFTLVEDGLDPVIKFSVAGDDEANPLEGWSENDRIDAKGGGDYAYGYGGDDLIDGGDGDDWLWGDGNGLDGNDVVIGGAGSDVLLGEGGSDRLYGDRLVSLADAIHDPTSTADPSKGDWLAAGEGDDVLVGSASSDVLTGGGGRDVLVGGAGNDFLMGDADYVPMNDAWLFTLRADGSPSIYSASNAAVNDPASSAADVIYGGAGDDWVWGGLGDDVIDGGPGKDLLFGNLGADTIEGGDGDDILAAGGRKQVDLLDLGYDYLSGGAGNDTLYGSAGDTVLFGGDGDDVIVAGPGADFIDGGAGNDRISSGGGADLIEGGDGDDVVTVFGTEGVSVYGGEGSDLLRGDQGEDALFGDAGDDVLAGDSERMPAGDGNSDVLDGGAGNDRYLMKSGGGVDAIYDESGEDVLEIRSIEGASPELAVSRDTIYLMDDEAGGVSLAFGVLGDRVELGSDPIGVIERIEIKHYLGATVTIEVIEFSELWETYVGPIVQANSAPALAQPLPAVTATEDEALSYAIPADAFYDADPDDLLSYTTSLSGGGELPGWLGFDPATLTFSGAPVNADVGSFEVTVTATDLWGESASTGFLITVANANDAPQVAGSIAAQSVEEESRFEFALSSGLFSDEDAGDTLLWSATLASGAQLPGWLAFDPDTKTFSGMPTRAEVGYLSVAVRAQDLTGASASLAFDLSVTKAPGKTLSGSTGSEVLQGGAGDDTLLGSPGADALIGGKGDDTFVLVSDGAWSAGYAAYNAGSPGNPGTGRIVSIQGKARLFDTLDGGEGFDTVQGTAGHDAVFLDDGLSPFPGAAGARLVGVDRFFMGAGNDTVDLTSLDLALGAVRIEGEEGDDLLWASAGDDTLLGGPGRDELYGGAGEDYLVGGTGDDSLDGAYGADVLQGGEGNDTLLDSSGGGVLDGGAGNDALTGSSAVELLVGGKGNDTLRPAGGSDVVLFNRGDGADRIAAGPGAKTLCFGGGIAYEDLALERTANHLVIHVGGGETVELTDWYASAANTGFRYMQVIAEAMAGFDPVGGDGLRDDKVEQFDFQGLVRAFDAARSTDPMITRWRAMDALLDAHLAGSDDEAIGGELAYRYGLTGTLAGQNLNSAQAAVASADFGFRPQPIASSAGAAGEALLG